MIVCMSMRAYVCVCVCVCVCVKEGGGGGVGHFRQSRIFSDKAVLDLGSLFWFLDSTACNWIVMADTTMLNISFSERVWYYDEFHNFSVSRYVCSSNFLLFFLSDNVWLTLSLNLNCVTCGCTCR